MWKKILAYLKRIGPREALCNVVCVMGDVLECFAFSFSHAKENGAGSLGRIIPYNSYYGYTVVK